RGFAGGAGGKVRARYQRLDRQDARTQRVALTARPCRRGDRIRDALLHLLTTANGRFCCRSPRWERQFRRPRGAQFEFTLAAIAQNLRRLAKLVARPPPLAATGVA